MAGGGAGNWSCRGEGRGGQALGDDGFVFSLPVCAAQTPPPARPLSTLTEWRYGGIEWRYLLIGLLPLA